MYKLKDGEEHPIIDIWNCHKWSDAKLVRVVDEFVVNSSDHELGEGFSVRSKPRFNTFYVRLGMEAARRIKLLSKKLRKLKGAE